jgi:hypothetical protein
MVDGRAVVEIVWVQLPTQRAFHPPLHALEPVVQLIELLLRVALSVIHREAGHCRVFNKDTVPMVLTFDALSAAQAYVGQNQPDTVCIVRVTNDGEREVVETGCL